MIISVGSRKGGVGKSTLTANIAVELLTYSKKIIIVEADQQGSIINFYEDRKTKDIDCISVFDNIKDKLKELNKKYDYVIVDSAGRDSLELRSSLLACDIFITPFRASQVDLDTLSHLSKLIDKASEHNQFKSYGVFSLASTHVFSNEVAEAKSLIEKMNTKINVVKTVIHDRKIYRDAIVLGQGVVETNNKKAKMEIKNLVAEILNESN